jgi:hypothetical protein
MQTYSVLNIYRTKKVPCSFVVSLQGITKEYYMIDPSFTDQISTGMLFIGDKITIREMTESGISFDLVEDGAPSDKIETNINFFYAENRPEIKPFLPPGTHFLPYLCDILPYNTQKIDVQSAVPEKNRGDEFTGKYKVEGQLASNLKLPLSGMFIAKIIQKTRINTYPTSFNPFFFVIASSGDVLIKIVFWIESLKKYSSLKVGDVIMVKDYRRKKKWTAFDKIDVNTFTESIYFDVEEITAKELVIIQSDNKLVRKHLFDTVEGRVKYLSVLMRHNYNDTLMEYVLVHVEDKKVVLFYNSDDEFYKIRIGNKIKIDEVRKMERAGIEFFISTIYTQLEVSEESIEESGIKRTRTEGNDLGIFGAIGFLPDNFKNLSEIMDYFHVEMISNDTQQSVEVPVNLFMKPAFISLSELSSQVLVLNESKKFILSSVITKIVDLECIIDYVENGENKKQGSFAIVLDDSVEVFVYDNFFNEKHKDFPSLRFKEDEQALIGKSQYFVIEAFRVDNNNVLYYLTGMIPS